jgi:asparagine synthase (glutamine-hydrolysing)
MQPIDVAPLLGNRIGMAGIICSNLSCSAKGHCLHINELSMRENRPEGSIGPIPVMTRCALGAGQPSAPPVPTLGRQPLQDDTGRWSLCFHGTLYNAADLRTEFTQKGRHCRSTADAELILLAFAEWGEASFRRLHGLFAIALYDAQDQALYLVRDPFGQKSLYYTAAQEHLFFASQLDLLVKLRPAVRLNTQGMLEWSLYRHLTSGATFFEDTFTLRPGHCLKFVHGRVEGRVCTLPTDYVSAATYERLAAAPEAAVISELEGALAKSVRDCLCGNGPVGTACSGGVDSSLVTALAVQSVPDLTAFNASAIDNAALDERRYAEVVAQALGIRLVCCPIDRASFQHALVRVIFQAGMPLPHIHVVALALMAEQAHAHGAQVLLTGDDADALFGGLWHRHRRQPQLRWVQSLFARLPRRLRNALALAASLHGGMPFTMVGLEGLIPHVVQALDRYARTEARLRLEKAYAFVPDEGSRAILVTMLEDFIDGWLLERADRLGTAVGVECRSPFAHPGLVELACNLPVRYRFRFGTDKWLLKKIAAGYIPHRVVYAKKRPWDFPWRDYLGPFAYTAAFRGGFCTDALHLSTLVIEELVASWENNAQVFWNLLNLEIWGRLFFLRQPIDQVAELFPNREN